MSGAAASPSPPTGPAGPLHMHRASAVTGRHRTHQLTTPGFWSEIGEIGEWGGMGRDGGKWGGGVLGGRLGGNAGKWGEVGGGDWGADGMGENGEMGENAGNWGERGGGGDWGGMGGIGGKSGKGGEMGGGVAGIAQGMWGVEGCGGMWLRKMGHQKGENWEEKGRQMGRNIHFSQSHCPRFSGGRRTSPSRLCKHQPTARADGKLGLLATHRRSPPRRMLGAWRGRGGGRNLPVDNGGVAVPPQRHVPAAVGLAPVLVRRVEDPRRVHELLTVGAAEEHEVLVKLRQGSEPLPLSAVGTGGEGAGAVRRTSYACHST